MGHLCGSLENTIQIHNIQHEGPHLHAQEGTISTEIRNETHCLVIHTATPTTQF